MKAPDVWRFADATRWRLVPPLRAAGARIGAPALGPVSGRHDRPVLFGALPVRTARRSVVSGPRETGSGAGALRAEMRGRYRRAPTIWFRLERGPAHTAVPTRRLAAPWGIELVWWPQQWPEWNAMDQWGKERKRLMAANRQAADRKDLVQQAEDWLLGLSPREALRQAGIFSPHFWLNSLLPLFWRPTEPIATLNSQRNQKKLANLLFDTLRRKRFLIGFALRLPISKKYSIVGVPFPVYV
jgi:DDE superfamily endonuclease